MKQIIRVGVDSAKNVFHIHAVDRHGQVLWTRVLKRSQWLSALCDKVPQGATIAMEACSSSHHWARQLQQRGYHVRLIAAQFVKPYVKSNKNDKADAEAICEAASRPTMRFVTPKSIDQQDRQALLRIRDELISTRTSLSNQIRGLVAEYGIVAPVGLNQLRRAIPCWLEQADNELSGDFRELLAEMYEDLCRLDERVKAQDARVARWVGQDPVTQQLMELRGVGPLSALALRIALGDGQSFSKGREFAASLGLTPRQHSSGGKDKLLGISKRGDGFLRKLLVHGARAVIRFAKDRDDGLSRWINQLLKRKHANVVTVALANKTARMAWALVSKDQKYDPLLAAGEMTV